MKVGVAFDAWKLSIFKRHLKDWKYETLKITEGENGPVVVFVFHIEVNDVEVLKLKNEVDAAVKETCSLEQLADLVKSSTIEVNDVEVLKLKNEVDAAVKETCRREKWRTN